MGAIIIGRTIISLFSTIIAWCGLRWHIGFTVQNRFTWGMRGSYIPLLHRVLLNFIWNAVQCWTGGKLVAVCITAIFPSFQNLNHRRKALKPIPLLVLTPSSRVAGQHSRYRYGDDRVPVLLALLYSIPLAAA